MFISYTSNFNCTIRFTVITCDLSYYTLALCVWNAFCIKMYFNRSDFRWQKNKNLLIITIKTILNSCYWSMQCIRMDGVRWVLNVAFSHHILCPSHVWECALVVFRLHFCLFFSYDVLGWYYTHSVCD